MIKIIKNDGITKKEDVYVIPFLEFYCRDLKIDIHFSNIPEEANKKRPDYYIDTLNELLEVKEIHDRVSNERSAQWGEIANKLLEATKGNELLKKVKGTYLVNTPQVFNLYKFKETSSQVLQEIINGIDKQKTIIILKIRFEIKKVSDQENIVVYGSMGRAGVIDPANIVFQNIKDKIETAHKQLSFNPNNQKPSKRILLLVNKYYFPLWNWDLFKAISRNYDDLLNYENIDEIWYQLETKDEGFIHKLLYRKSFFEQFEKSKFKNYQTEDLELFANWFSALAEMEDKKKNKLLSALKHFLKDKRPDEIFPDSQTRIEMVRFGLWLGEKELFDEVVWTIEKFITDSDPPKPEDYKEDQEFNYHNKIINNENINTIATVLGHLAWDVQKLAIDKKNIIKSLEFTKKLFSHPNLYIKLESLIPLIEIAKRRQCITEYDNKHNTKYFKKFSTTVFECLNKYSKYNAFGPYLVDIFSYFKDLNITEAINVLNKLERFKESAPLFIYFSTYREKHYINKGIFHGDKIKTKFTEIILSTDKKYENLQDRIIWYIRDIIKHENKEFSTLLPYIELYFRKSYHHEKYYGILIGIIEDWIDRKPKLCLKWFTEYVNKVTKYVDRNKERAKNIWIVPTDILKYIAKNKPELLIKQMENLVNLWKLGAFIGDMQENFSTYELVKDSQLRKQVLNQYKSWDIKIKDLPPKIKQTNFD